MTVRAQDRSTPSTSIRCAVYCRQSVEERNKSDYSSIDAQREAGENFVRSHVAAGWVLLPERYDDPGYSGGNTDRPGLQRLLADIKRNWVQTVIVYRVDRLSRSIVDSAQIVDLMTKHDCAFVSIAETIDTSTASGRLYLTIVTMFAQHEREVIAERTRDKMHAARKRGRWIGGVPPLGYDVHSAGGRIVVNEDEAARVRVIFGLYLEHESLLSTVRDLDRRGWRTKSWTTRRGIAREGHPFKKSSLAFLLRNRVYTGQVEFKGEVVDGEHERIVDQDVWDRVQAVLTRNGCSGGRAVRTKYGAFLTGLLFCATCDVRMGPTYTRRKERMYRYYCCSRLQRMGRDACSTPILPAGEIERLVLDRIRAIGTDEQVLSRVREQLEGPSDGLEAALAEFESLWLQLTPAEQTRIVDLLIEKVSFDPVASILTFNFRASGIRTLMQKELAL